MAPVNRRRVTCGSFDIPDLPKIMSSLDLSEGSPSNSCIESPSNTERIVSPCSNADPDTIVDLEAGGTRSSARNRLSRASKSDCLLRMNRRVSMKPQRKVAKALGSEDDVKKFYLNNKLGSAASRTSALETIFEEPSLVKNELKMIGLRKIKRSVNFKDGITISKTTVQSRRKRIKTIFGTTGKKFNKLSMDAFLQHLQSISSEPEEEDALPYRSAAASTAAGPLCQLDSPKPGPSTATF